MQTGGTKILGLSLVALALITMAAAAVLYCFDPATVGIYPVCYFHQFTGLQCPGCGGLRAAHQLLHGNIAAAFRLNAFAVLAAPFFLWLCGRFVFRALKNQPSGLEIRQRWLWTALALLVVYGIVRNVIQV